MPPKQGSAKKKLSKAEKEKLKKEEAEKKAQEEEEARLREEEEAAEKKERDKQEAEQRRKLENEERKQRKGQLQELDAIWESNRATLESEKAERRKNAKWARYMRCDGSPDPTVQGEINAYINLWREDLENNDIDPVLKKSLLTLSLIDEVDFLLRDTPPTEISEEEVTLYKNTITELQELLKEKLDLASHNVLLEATYLADPETTNLQKVVQNDLITLCTWGNLSKNPRIKSHEFEEKGFTFEIPRLLTLSDCAIRVLFTKYDHLSPQCKTFFPRPKKKVEEPPPPQEEENQEEKKEEEPEKKEGEGEEEEEAGIEREETEDVMAALNKLNDDGEEKEEEKVEEEPAEEEPMEEDYEIKTPEPTEWEDFDGDEDMVDLRAYQVMGDIFHFNLLQLPPQPKNVKTWVLRQVIDPPVLETIEYVSDNVNPVPVTQAKEAEEKEKKDERPPIGVTMRLPEDVYFCEEPQVCRWDSDNKQWRLDGFTDHSFNEESRMLSFKTSFFGTMALVQDIHINMPFQSWELRPHGTNSALLTIIAAIVEVEIEIKDGECCLAQPDDRPELDHIRDKWMTPMELVQKLKAAGINVFPNIDSPKYVSIQNKHPVTEDCMYQQMALTASSMAYSWSKWNSEVQSDEKIIIQGAEQLHDEPLLEEDWGLFLITKKRTMKLKMTEFDENFSEDYAEGTSFVADLYHMVMDLGSEEGCERIRNTNYKFVDCVYQLLCATKVVTYS